MRAWAAVTLAAGLLLTGCDGLGGDEDPDDDTSTQTDGAEEPRQDETGDAQPEDIEPPTEPADIQPVAGDRSASRDGNTVSISGDRAAFVTPTGNLACTVSSTTAVCQASDMTFTPQADHLVADTIGDCTANEADAMMLAPVRGAWTCPPQPLAPQADLDLGGWWAAEVNAETTDVGGVDAAVLPYGVSLTVGSVTCMSGENGVSCSSNEIGQSFFLSRTTYNYG